MAKEYIDRETTIDAITADGFEHFSGCLSSSEVTLLELIRDSVSEIPTVDAVEVVHGEWISLTDCSNAGVYCSVCKKKVWKEDYAWCNKKNKLRSNYCPNCGAKMDGGRQDEM